MEEKTSAQRRQFVLPGLLIVLCTCLWLIFEKPIRAARPMGHGSRALSNLKQIGTSFAIYLADHDDRMPPAASWSDDLAPYAKDDSLFRSPEHPEGPISVAFMKRLSGMKYESIPNPSRQAMAFETTRQGPNVALNFTEVAWRADRKTAVGFVDTSARSFSESDPKGPAIGTGLTP